MSSHVFVLLIVFIGCATALISRYLRVREANEEQNTGLDETVAQLEALEERIRVLERIVTEKKFDLKREIDRL